MEFLINIVGALAIAMLATLLLKWVPKVWRSRVWPTGSQHSRTQVREATAQSAQSLTDKSILFSRSLRELEIEFRTKYYGQIELVEKIYFTDQVEGNRLIQELVQRYLDEHFDDMVPLALRSFDITPDQEQVYIENFKASLERALPAQWADAAYIRSAVQYKRQQAQ